MRPEWALSPGRSNAVAAARWLQGHKRVSSRSRTAAVRERVPARPRVPRTPPGSTKDVPSLLAAPATPALAGLQSLTPVSAAIATTRPSPCESVSANVWFIPYKDTRR